MKNIYKKQYNYFYRQELSFAILYILLNLLLFANLYFMNNYSRDFITTQGINIGSLFLYLILIVSYYFLNLIMLFIGNNKLVYSPINRMMYNLFYRTLQKRYDDYLKKNQNDYMYYIRNLTSVIMTTFPSFFFIISSVLQMIFLSILLFNNFLYPFLICVLLLPVFELISNHYYKKFENLYTLRIEKGKDFYDVIIKYLSSIRTVKIYSLEKYCLDKIIPKNKEDSELEAEYLYSNSAIRIIGTIRNYFVPTAYIILIVLFNKGNNINFGEVIVSLFLMVVFIQSFSVIITSYLNIRRNKSNVENLIEHYEEISKNDNLIVKDENDNIAVSLKDVSYSYERDGEIINIFDKINIDIIKGDKVVIIGENGGGKSTLLRLLSHISDVKEGKILIDPSIQNKNDYNPTEIKNAFISTSPFIFNISLKDNVVFNKELNDDKVRELLKDVRLDGFVNSLPNNINTVIDMDSLTISDGEKTRIAVSRSIPKKEEIEIIFLDEFTKNFDSSTEEAIIDKLFSHFDNKTIVAISHRLSTILRFDKIIFINRNNKSVSYISKNNLVNNSEIVDYLNLMK